MRFYMLKAKRVSVNGPKARAIQVNGQKVGMIQESGQHFYWYGENAAGKTYNSLWGDKEFDSWESAFENFKQFYTA